ncbi:MAG: fibronectin type III domain-containing protein, partial [Planctomycetota bacterium]
MRCKPAGVYFENRDGKGFLLSSGNWSPRLGAGTIRAEGAWGRSTRSVFTSGPGFLKECIVLDGPIAGAPAAQGWFLYATDIEDAGGLRPFAGGKPVENGQSATEIEFRNSAGKVVFSVPRPVAWDDSSAGSDGSRPHTMFDYTIQRRPGGWRLSVRVPASWLLSPARRFPVTIDPTFNLTPATGFGYQASSWYLNNYGYAGNQWRAWFKWNITSIPDTASITLVEHRNYCDAVSASTAAIKIYDFTGTNYGPYTAWNSVVYADLGAGNIYAQFTATTIGYYPSSTTYYQLSNQASTDLQSCLAGNQFQFGLADAGATSWMRFCSPNVQRMAIRVTYFNGPPAPGFITVPATSVGGNYTITWGTSAGATSYELEEDTVATFSSPTQVYNGSNTSHSFTNHPPGTFYYRVRARDAIGPSGWTVGTNPCVVTIPPPSPPGSITVPQTSASGNFQVSWTVSTGAVSYDLQEANNTGFNGATLVYQGANLNYNVTGKVGGTWYYRVRGVNAGGNSTWTVGANGCQIIPPNPPASMTVPQTSASGNYTVSWAASQGATGYDLQEDTTASFTNPSTVYTGANTQFNVTGKTSGTFYYRVRASNLVGSSTWTAGANGCQIVPPQAPASITVPATSATGNYQVSWTAVTDASSYDLEEDTSASFTNATTVYQGANTFFDVTGKTSGTYYYRVRAVGVAGSSPWTTDTTGCTIVPPAPPASITVPIQSMGVFQVDWVASAGATSYDLEEDSNPGFTNPTQVYSGANLSYTAVQSSGTWYYRVRAVNGAGPSTWTNGSNGCTIIPPNAPTPLTVPATSSTGSYAVTWGSSLGATGYELQEDTSSSFTSPTTLCNGANLSFTVMGKPNGTYYYRVRASNGAGSSTWTVDTTGCAVSLMPPAAPGTLTVPMTSSTGNYVVSWTSVAGAWTFELEEALTPSFSMATQVYTGAAVSFSVTGRANGTYYYRVRGVNPAGQSSWTNGSNGCTVTLSVPSAPGFLNVPATSSTGNYSLDWGLSSGATLY